MGTSWPLQINLSVAVVQATLPGQTDQVGGQYQTAMQPSEGMPPLPLDPINIPTGGGYALLPLIRGQDSSICPLWG